MTKFRALEVSQFRSSYEKAKKRKSEKRLWKLEDMHLNKPLKSRLNLEFVSFIHGGPVDFLAIDHIQFQVYWYIW